VRDKGSKGKKAKNNKNKKRRMIMKRMTLLSIWVVSLSVMGLIIGSFGGTKAYAETSKMLTIGSPPVGQSYQVCATGIAAVLTKHTKMKVLNKPMSGAGEYLPMVNNGSIDLSMTNGNEVYWGFVGDPRISEEPLENLRLIRHGNWLTGVAGIIVKANSGIHRINDLRGKKVGGDYGPNPVSGAPVTAWLQSAGLTWKDVKKVPVSSIKEGINELRAGRIDACFGGSVMASYFQELAAAVPVRPLPFADTPVDKIDKIPQSVIDKIKRETLPIFEVTTYGPFGKIVPEKYTTIRFPAWLMASIHVSPQTVYEVSKILATHYKELVPYHSWMKQWTPQNMLLTDPEVPYHEGAIRFYKEKGLWTDELDRKQKALINQAK
jgi:TRAP transporter TAXI family solute receptor